MKNRRIYLLLFVASLGVAGPAVAQEDLGIEFVAMPEPGPHEHNGYFRFTAERGETVEQRLLLRNDADHPLVLKLAPLDAETGLYGGVDYGLDGEEVDSVGTWIELSRSRVRLAPGASTSVPFEVRVPRDAPTGHNLSGIGIYPVGENRGAPTDEGATAQVVVVQRRVVAVQVDVPGVVTPRLEISGVKPLAQADGIYLGIRITSSGSALTKGEGTVQVSDDERFTRDFSLATFVPGTKIVYPIKWRESASNGEYEASVRIDYDNGRKVAEWSGTFVIGDGLQSDPSDKGGRAQLGSRWRDTAVVAVALVLALFLAWRIRERRRSASVPATVPARRGVPPSPTPTASIPVPPPASPSGGPIPAPRSGPLVTYAPSVVSHHDGDARPAHPVNGSRPGRVAPPPPPPPPPPRQRQGAG